MASKREFTTAQKDWCRRYEQATGFEPTIDDGGPFEQFVQQNIHWFENWSSEALYIISRLWEGSHEN